MRSRIVTRLPAPVGRALEMNGHVFGVVTSVAMAALLVVAAMHQQVAVVAVLGLGLSTVGVSRLWSGLALRSVTIGREFDRHALFPGEELSARIQIANNKLLPLPWLDATQELPHGLCACEPGKDPPDGPAILRSFSLPWYAKVTWSERLVARRRGAYVIPRLDVASGDILGLYPRAMNGSAPEHVVVYPRLYPVHYLSTPRTDASGERAGLSTLQEDPTRMRGIRDYAPGDGMKRVHWKATARHNEIKVKLFEPAAVSRVQLALVVDGFHSLDTDDFELAVSAVASVARFCIERQQQVGLYSNGRTGDSDAPALLPAGAGDHHLMNMLELLARVTSSSARPFEVLAEDLRRLALAGAAIIAVTGRLEPLHVRAYEQLSRTSPSFRVLVVDSHSRTQHVSFPSTHVRSPDDLLAIGGRA
jgi:uncharacterized protein (DUF58 family)